MNALKKQNQTNPHHEQHDSPTTNTQQPNEILSCNIPNCDCQFSEGLHACTGCYHTKQKHTKPTTSNQKKDLRKVSTPNRLTKTTNLPSEMANTIPTKGTPNTDTSTQHLTLQASNYFDVIIRRNRSFNTEIIGLIPAGSKCRFSRINGNWVKLDLSELGYLFAGGFVSLRHDEGWCAMIDDEEFVLFEPCDEPAPVPPSPPSSAVVGSVLPTTLSASSTASPFRTTSAIKPAPPSPPAKPIMSEPLGYNNMGKNAIMHNADHHNAPSSHSTLDQDDDEVKSDTSECEDEEIIPGHCWTAMPQQHPLYKAFFLVKKQQSSMEQKLQEQEQLLHDQAAQIASLELTNSRLQLDLEASKSSAAELQNILLSANAVLPQQQQQQEDSRDPSSLNFNYRSGEYSCA